VACATSVLRWVMPSPVPVETLILVDVDGVLNVGLHDGRNHAVAFTDDNLQVALGSVACEWKKNPLAERLCSVASKRLEHGEGATYSHLVADSGNLSQVLVGRLARLIETAGQASRVVLSSTWRRPTLRCKRKYLEASLSQHLGRPFIFHGCTPDCNEQGAQDRLRILGDYISVFCAHCSAKDPKLRVLVLDDFSINSLSNLSCDGETISNAEAAERYLLSRSGDGSCASVRLVHTYDSWTTCKGLPVAIGCGLTMEHFSSAMSFLCGECQHCVSRMRDGQALKLGDADAAPKRSSSRIRIGRSITQLIGKTAPRVLSIGRSKSM